MTAAETLHLRTMLRKNEIVKLFVTLIDKEVGVKSILQNMISNYQDMNAVQKQKQGPLLTLPT
jgi:hypothetical protein